jgi:hypothetical protein
MPENSAPKPLSAAQAALNRMTIIGIDLFRKCRVYFNTANDIYPLNKKL